MLDSLAAMRAFVQAAEKRSFKLAGQVLGLTPSAVGKAIQKLEEQLSVSLFHRSTRSIAITDEGIRFLERCRAILAEAEAAEAELAGARQAPSGRLKISLPAEPIAILPIVTAFAAAYPQIELDLDVSDRMADVIAEGFDAVIRSGEPDDSRLRLRRLAKFHWKIVASPAYVDAHGAPNAVADLTDHRCLRQRSAATGLVMPWHIDEVDEATLPVTIAATAMGPLIDFALADQGIACLPAFAVAPQLASGRLIELFAAQPRHSGMINMLWPASRHPLPKVRVFVDFVAAHLARELGVASDE